jgi:Glycosyltransferase family 87
VSEIAVAPPMRRLRDRVPWHVVRAALAIAGLTYLLGSIFGLIPFTLQAGVTPGLDTVAYWGADLSDLYAGAQIGERDAYLYSPAFAQLLVPLRWLPFEVVYALWLIASIAALAWMRVLWTLAFPPVLADLYFGNIHVFYALAIVIGFRVSATWALPLLTKVTPGMGVLWFAIRREWRPFIQAIVATAAIAGVSFLIAPGLWFDWIDSLTGNVGRDTGMRSDAIPLAARLAVAAAILAWAALTDRRWALPFVVWLASPTIWPGTAAVLVASVSPRLRESAAGTAGDSVDSLGGPIEPRREPASVAR